jgi:predicted transcriptional regulator
LEPELNIHVKKVLGALHKLSKGKEDFSVSYTDISKVSKLEKPMVSSCLRYLRENFYINVISGGGAATNIYSFLKEVPEAAIKSIQDVKPAQSSQQNITKPQQTKRKIRP